MVPGSRVVPAGRQFDELQLVRRVAVDLVGAHEHEWSFGGVAPVRFQEVECAGGVRFEVVEGTLGGKVVGWLRSAVDDRVRPDTLEQVEDRDSVPDVRVVVAEAWVRLAETLEVPRGVAVRAEEVGSHVVVDSDDLGFE